MTSPSLYQLFSQYWERYEAVCNAMALTDATDYDTPERDAAFSAQFAAGDLLDEIECAICAFVPRRRFEAMLKTRFIAGMVEDNGGQLDALQMNALLSSLPTLVRHVTTREAVDESGQSSGFAPVDNENSGDN